VAKNQRSPEGREPAEQPFATIRVVSNRTGISPDTLRIWERRYGFPKPMRRDDGIRVYDEKDIQRIELIARALEAGFRPHEVMSLEEGALRRAIQEQAPPPAGAPSPKSAHTESRPAATIAIATEATSVEAILESLTADDLSRVRSQLRAAAALLGPREFVTELAYPLAKRVGEEWARGRLEVRHEHAMSTALSMQLHLLLGAFEDARARGAGPLVLLATLPNEHHALALDMVALFLASSGALPRVLGPDTPPDQIVLAAKAIEPKAVGVSVSLASDKAAALEAIRVIAKGMPRTSELWIGGSGAASIPLGSANLPGRVHRIGKRWADIEEALARIA